MFTSSPQSVEVHEAGTWWRGELLGWRHDDSGICQMRVRVAVGGVEETAWVDLAVLRLPQTQADPAAAARPLVADAATTAALPMIRDEVVAPVTAVRAVAVAPTVSVPGPRGRRRASEDPGIQVATAQVAVPPGRHRDSRDEGRHRAADTEVFAAVAEKAPATVAPTVADGLRRVARSHAGAGSAIPQVGAARPGESFGRPEVCAGRAEAEPDLLTRPMRLGDLSPSSRRPTASGSRSGA